MLDRVARRKPAEVRAEPAPPQLRGVPSNHLLARQQVPGEPLPHPNEQPAHTQAFDAFVSGLITPSDPAALTAARAACDGPVQSGEQTLDYGGHKLIVDQRNRTAVLTRIRWRAMDRIHELSAQHGATEQGATDEAGRVAARKALLDGARPYLTFLQGEIADPQSRQNRFEHWYDAVQRSVLRVLELLAVEDAQGTGLKADGTGKTRDELAKEQKAIKDMGTEAWCGAFAGLAMSQAGISTAVAKAQLDGEAGILSFMNYDDVVSQKKIRLGEQTMKVRDFHASRNSLRKTQVIANADGSPGFAALKHAEVIAAGDVQVNPGDILLLDRTGGNRPDHVMIATSSDIGAMTKIAGNETATPGGQVAQGGAYDIRHQPDAITPAQHAPYERKAWLKERKKSHPDKWTADDEAELTKIETQLATFEASHPKQSRIAAVCRFSIVDFEVHDYV